MTHSGGWFRNVRAFPEAIDKRGDPQTDHPSVLKYLKENP
jgi:hypothetical protein